MVETTHEVSETSKGDSDKQYVNLQSHTLIIGRHCCSMVRLSRFTSMDLFRLNLYYQCLSLLLPICRIIEYELYKMLVLQCLQFLPDKNIWAICSICLSNKFFGFFIFYSYLHISLSRAPKHMATAGLYPMSFSNSWSRLI